MKTFTPAELDEMHKLMTILGENELEETLKDLNRAFGRWKRGTLSFTGLDNKIMEYVQTKEGLQRTDPVVTIADAIAEEKLVREDVSDGLFAKIEIVVRLMKN